MDHRLQVLEQKLLVMQREVSEVIGELQQAMTALMKAQAIATAVMNSRVTELEAGAGTTPRTKEGVEL